MKHWTVALALMGLVCGVPAMAGELGSIRGIVTVAGAAAAAHVEMKILDAKTGALMATVTTDENGEFRVPYAAPGEYRVELAGADAGVVAVSAGGGEAKAALKVSPQVYAQGVRRGGENKTKVAIGMIGSFVAGVVVVVLIIIWA